MTKKKLIRDAVHGDIEVGPLESELIDTPEFQRLRGIKQLGTAHLVFPSAVHTRFEHSLGTSWMAHRIVEAVRRTETVSADEEKLIRISALPHDITHIPFGHTLEDERSVLPRHVLPFRETSWHSPFWIYASVRKPSCFISSVALAVMWRRHVRASYEGTEPPPRLHNSIRTLWRRELRVWPDRQTFLN
jgi:hypothetical protein